MKKILFVLLLVLTVPTFYRMLQPGIYSMQDFHFFRLAEFDKCVKDFQLPCRWSPDAGLGYGEPLFNFYGQAPFIVGEIIHLIGFSLIISLKASFIISLIASFFTMFFFAKRLWNDTYAGIISGLLYLYAPYRALDVWVRGALPEAMAFVLFPLILLKVEDFIKGKSTKDGVLVSILIALLIITHNLSFIMFLPIMCIWSAFRIYESRSYKIIPKFVLVGTATLGLASFYLLPVVTESKFIDLKSTIEGYFNFRGHFAGISQLLIQRFWGYGGSVFGPEDGLSLSVGHIQWILPIVTVLLLVKNKKIFKNPFVLISFLTGWFYVFLTHNKSTFIWEKLAFMSYIQFPWRFIGMAVFCFSICGGFIAKIFSKAGLFVSIFLGISLVVLNTSFFKEDIWYKYEDKDLVEGTKWEDQTRASIRDYWPVSAEFVQSSFAPKDPIDGKLIQKGSNFAIYEMNELSKGGQTSFPINYFPGWQLYIDNKKLDSFPYNNGLITANLPSGSGLINIKFSNTPIRTFGNIISLVTIVMMTLFSFSVSKQKISKKL